MEQKDEYKKIDYRAVFREIGKRKKLFFVTIPITILLSSLYIICIPRTYSSSTEIAPESEGSPSASNSTLGSLASTFGLDMSALESSDAITPMLYPDLMNDNGFIAMLFKVNVKTIDGKFNGNFYNYLLTYKKLSWWASIIEKLSKEKTDDKKTMFNPYQLSKRNDKIVSDIREHIKITVDKKTGAITISTEAQDPLVAKMIADATREQLKVFIVKYRTNKARNDVEYYNKLTEEAKESYEKQRRVYGSFSDANTDVNLPSLQSKEEDLENEMQLRYNNYSQLKAQLQIALAKLRERTPVFTQIQGAAVPIRPTGPKRMIFVLVWTLLAFFGTSIFILREITLPKK